MYVTRTSSTEIFFCQNHHSSTIGEPKKHSALPGQSAAHLSTAHSPSQESRCKPAHHQARQRTGGPQSAIAWLTYPQLWLIVVVVATHVCNPTFTNVARVRMRRCAPNLIRRPSGKRPGGFSTNHTTKTWARVPSSRHTASKGWGGGGGGGGGEAAFL
jgi:hypothetical protein